MRKLTTIQWKQIENMRIHDMVKLKVDGQLLQINLTANYATRKIEYLVFFEDGFKNGDFSETSDRSKKYLNPQIIISPNRNQYKKLCKKLGVKKCKEIIGEPQKRIIGYFPHFNSFKTLKKVLIDNNESIEIYDYKSSKIYYSL